MPTITTPQTIHDLLGGADLTVQAQRGELLQFHTADGHDVYNITPPFMYDKAWVLAGRVEARNDEVKTKIRFFRRDPQTNTWKSDLDLPELDLQDPFVTLIDGRWIVGGVKVLDTDLVTGQVLSWRTDMYVGSDLHHLSLLVEGPQGMKDIRLIQLDSGIGIFTRPQGQKGGRGKIGFTTVTRLEEITTQLLEDAPLIPGLLHDDEWGGVNEAHLLSSGLLGVVGHIARYDEHGKRAYYVMSFVFNPDTFEFRDQRIIASRNCFPVTDAKRDDLYDIVFPGGLRQRGDTAVVYAGLSDTSAGAVLIPNPFAS